MALGVYSPKAFDVTITETTNNINHVVAGFAEGTLITLSPISDRNSFYQGGKGEGSVVVSASEAYNLVIHLAQTSRSNDILFKLLHKKDYTYDPTFEIQIKDRSSGTTQFYDGNAFVSTEAEFAPGTEVATRDWTIILPKPEGSIGGNGKFGLADANAFRGLGGDIPQEFDPGRR